MSPSPKLLSFLFLLLLISSLQIQARESQFFIKVTPHNKNNNSNAKAIKITHTELPQPEPEPEHHPETHSGYGLYGHSTAQYPHTTTTNGAYYNSGDLPTKTPTEEYVGGNYEYKEFTTGYPNNNNGYETKEKGMNDPKFLENYYRNGYEYSKRGSQEGFGSSRGVNSRNEYNYGGYYGNEENSYEFNNSMEGYQNQVEEYQESREEYVP